MTDQTTTPYPAMPKVSLSKVPAGLAPWEAETLHLSRVPSEWELDRRRTMINPTVSTLTGHHTGLTANNPHSLESMFQILASIGPREHRWNRQTIGVDIFGR